MSETSNCDNYGVWEIRIDDLSSPEIRAFIGEHLTQMHEQSPPESTHALGIESLQAPEVNVYSASRNGVLEGMGAFAVIGETDAELKSMRTSEAVRGQGLGRLLLRHLIDEARAAGIERLWLETESGPEYAAARGLYTSEGFVPCPPFGDYTEDPESVFFHLKI